ncbi:hypothetical protein ACROYT_G012329 [Oculina patagonica]
MVSTYHHKDVMVLVSKEPVNRTWESRSKGDKGAKAKQPWQGKCWRCDKPSHIVVSRNHTCSKCGNRGHMEVCCRTKQDKQGKGKGKSGRKREGVRTIGDQPDQGDVEGSEVSEGDRFFVFSASEGESNTLPLMFESELVSVIIDSGATCNLMYEQVFDKVCKGKLELLETVRKVYAYASQEPLKLNGKCMLNISVPDTQTSLKAEFFVMPGTADTLLGRSSSEKLNFLKVGVSVNACESKNITDKKAALKSKYPHVITACRRNVEKPNGDVCISLYMRQANRAILKEKQPVPTIEETLQEISGAKVFSKLDLNMTFHQVELAPESRDITTFAGPNGLYRYKCLIFGVTLATEKFQHIIRQVLKDCPSAHNIHDDIRVVGVSEEQHNERSNQS